MDLVVRMDDRNKLSPKMKRLGRTKSAGLLNVHHARDPEGRYRSLGQVRKGGRSDQSAASGGPASGSVAVLDLVWRANMDNDAARIFCCS